MRCLIIVSLICFGLSLLFGLCVTYYNYYNLYNLNLTKVVKFNNNLSGIERPYYITFTSILKTNLIVIARLLTGAILFALPTFVCLVVNGYYFGSYIATAILNNSLNKFIILTLPHGIFEIPATIIAGAAGFKIPYEIIRYLAGKKKQILTKEDIKEYLTLALISIILIVIAAWIGANITLKIAKAMLRTKGI